MAGFDKTTNISWANKTWNVIVGCEKISPACKRCYAMYVANKEEQKGIKKFNGLTSIAKNGEPVWNGNINISGEKLFNEPKRWKEPSIIFVNSMSDLFYEAVPEELVFKIIDKMMLMVFTTTCQQVTLPSWPSMQPSGKKSRLTPQ